MCFRKLLILTLLVIISNGVFSQYEVEYNYQRDYLTKFDQYSADEGLSNRRVLDVYQDQYGYMWIGTEDGLNRFDGYSFQTFFAHDKDSTSLSNSHITSITEDIYGNLWIGTLDGLNLFNREKEIFVTYTHEEFKENSLSNNYVRTLYADTSGNLWIETVDGVLNKYDIKQDSFNHFIHDKIEQPYYEYHDIYQDKDGDLWIGGRTMGPYRFDKEEGKFYLYRADPNDPDKKRDNDVGAFLEDSRGVFWISGIDGIYRFYKPTGRFSKFYGTSTYDILEDQNGKIWFATGNGVLQYNYRNKNLVHFFPDQNNPHSLGSDNINCVYEDRSGNIWFGTDEGLNKYSPGKYKFDHIYHIPGNNKTIISNQVSALMQDSEGYLWIGTNSSGLSRMDLDNHTIQHYQENKEISGTLSSNNISDLYQDRNGDIWVGLWRGIGFNKYNRKNGEFTLYALNPNSLKSDWYNDFLEDSQGNFWTGIWGASGMQLFDRETGKFVDSTFNPIKNNPISRRISALTYDGERYLWIGSRQVSTIYRYDFTTGKFHYIKKKWTDRDCKGGAINILPLPDGSMIIAKSEGLSLFNNQQKRFFCYNLPAEAGVIKGAVKYMKDSVILLSTTKGIYRFLIESKEFVKQPLASTDLNIRAFDYSDNKLFYATTSNLYIYNFNTNQTQKLDIKLAQYRVTDLLFSQFSELWIGTEEGLYQYNIRAKQLTTFKKRKNSKFSISGELITALYEDSAGTIWIGTLHGLNCYHPSDSTVRIYRADKDKPNTLINNHVLSVEQGPDGDMWIGTLGGLCMYKKEQNKFVNYNKPDKYSLTSRLTTDMYEDSRGYIWVGTSDKGLNRISPGKNHIDHFTHASYDTSSLSSNEVNSIYEDSKGRIWIGTTNGLNLFRESTMDFSHFSEEDGFPDNNIMAILEDDQLNLWISTHNGLVKFNPKNETMINYFKSDGLQSNRFTKAHCKLQDGRLAFGGEKGINIFDPQKLKSNTRSPALQITAFEKFDKVIKTDFTRKKTVVLSHNENFFTIHFSSMDYTAPEKNRYKYKLEGINKNWVEVEQLNKASYTDIDPGEYVFKVMGTNNDHIWSNEPVELRIILEPPFYRTAWFYLTVFLLFAAIIFIYVRLRILSLKKEKNNVELEQKLLRSQMNPHFIFNSLTSIQNYVLEKETSKANRYLAKFSKLLRLILDNSRNNYITLNQEIQTIEHYLLLQKIRYGDKFEYYLDVDEAIEEQYIAIPPMLTQPFIENAIEHGFQPIDYKGILNVRFRLIDKELEIIVEDNGIGIDTAKRLKKKKIGSYKSLATKITEERILNMNRFSKQKIKIDIYDLSNIDKEKQGTRVILKVPFLYNTGELKV